jgi:glycosyltransferase involved in cell wall biosynthesis
VISILIPVYNEEDILEASAIRLHEYLSALNLDHELVVTSNGSTDATETIGRALETRYPWFRFYVLSEKGVGTAFAHGVTHARGEYVVSLDIDLSFELRFIDYVRDLLQHGDMIVGSKTMGRQRRSLLRVLASQMYILMAQLLFNLTISDYSIGCKAYRRSAILPALEHLDSWTGYVVELAVWFNLQGKKIIQIGVDCDDRRKSHFNLLHEGFYRYLHLYRVWRAARKDSWFRKVKCQ